MRPTKLVARNFRRHRELDLDLSGGGLIAVLGEIHDSTSGANSNGAGKSSILEAIEIALFGRRSLSPYVTRGQPDDLLLELEFTHADSSYRTRRTYSQRGKGKATLDFEVLDIDGEWVPLTCASIKETQERICATVGLTRATFRHSSYLRQKARSIADESLEPSERQKLLAEGVQGPDPVWPKRLEQARTLRRDLDGKLHQLTGKTAQAEEQAALLPELERAHGDTLEAETVAADNVADLERSKGELAVQYQAAREHAGRLVAAAAELKTVEGELATLTTRSQDALKAEHARAEAVAALAKLPAVETVEKLETVAARHTATIEAHRLAVVAHDRLVQAIRVARQRRDGLLERAQEARTKADELRVAIETLEATPADEAICDRCEQHLGVEARKVARASMLNEASGYADTYRTVTVEANAIVIPETPAEIEEPLRAREGLDRTNELLEGARAAVAERAVLEERIRQCDLAAANGPPPDKMAAAHALYLEKRDALEAVGTPPDVNTITAQGSLVAEQLKTARTSLDQHRTQRTRLDERIANANAAAATVAEYKSEREALQSELAIISALEEAVAPNGIPAWLLENTVIPYLETEASRILPLLGCPYRVELRTQAEKKAGGLRDTCDVVVLDENGEQAPFEEGTSGGEKTRIGLALQVALAELLAQGEPGLLALDEPGDLDEAGMAALVDVLRGLQGRFEPILVVSHVPALRDSFDQTITVVRDEHGSRVLDAGVFEVVPA